ncbi:hypothetical protein VIGAN_01228900, partial [Vigna angularis var. angularis]
LRSQFLHSVLLAAPFQRRFRDLFFRRFHRLRLQGRASVAGFCRGAHCLHSLPFTNLATWAEQEKTRERE